MGDSRSETATERVWQKIEAVYGLLTGDQVGEILRAPVDRDGLLSVVRHGVRRYPAFQFDDGEVLPVIAELLELARATSWANSDVIIWLIAPNTDFEGLPVDHLRETDELLAAARDAFEGDW